MDLLPSFFIGLVGSLHCIGMCGPIVLALPTNTKSSLTLIIGRTLYNIGRILTYSLMGAFAGLFANQFLLAGLQKYVSIILGIVIVVYLILPNKFKSNLANNLIYKNVSALLKKFYSTLNVKGSYAAYFIFGLVNGLLPCGLVYVALIGSFSAGSFLHGFLFMLAFGVGTFPVMFLTSLLGKFISLNLRRKVTKLVPYLTFLLAVIFILRGLNLGIPFISPNLDKMEKKIEKNIEQKMEKKQEVKSDCCG